MVRPSTVTTYLPYGIHCGAGDILLLWVGGEQRGPSTTCLLHPSLSGAGVSEDEDHPVLLSPPQECSSLYPLFSCSALRAFPLCFLEVQYPAGNFCVLSGRVFGLKPMWVWGCPTTAAPKNFWAHASLNTISIYLSKQSFRCPYPLWVPVASAPEEQTLEAVSLWMHLSL